MKDIVVILGPTASGKTDVSLRMAKIFDIEIVSADSAQIYTGFDIGSAKPGPDELKQVKHHCIDIVSAEKDFTVAEYLEYADKAIQEISESGKIPFVVGGTGLYIDAILYGLAPSPGADEDVRKKYEKIYIEKGINYLYNLLFERDPESAHRIHPNDKKRIIRALEVFEVSGKTLSSFHHEHKKELRYRPLLLGLTCERKILYDRINMRVDSMFKQGIVEETRELLFRYNKEANAFKALGYRQVIQYFEGEYTLESACEQIKQKTRNFAKRQYTWFNKYRNIIWCDITENNKLNKIEEIIRQFRGGGHVKKD